MRSKFKSKINNKNKNIYVYIILIVLFIILICLIYSYYKDLLESFESYGLQNNLESNDFYTNNDQCLQKEIKYFRCEEKQLGNITKNIFDQYNIQHSNEEWDLYYPCGYNFVEQELKNIKINNNIIDKFIFGINGCDNFVSKNNLWLLMEKHYGRYEASKLIPESFILNDSVQLNLFNEEFDNRKKNIYILKKNLQRKEGLKLTKDLDEIIFANSSGYVIVQKYITDLYLINERKINLRMYLLIMIKHNKIYFYLSKEGKCIYTNKKYNYNDFDFETNITSYNLDMSVYQQNPRFLNELIQYMNIKDGAGSGEKLFYRINENLKKISDCISNHMYQSDNIKGATSFQLFGIDIIFNNNLEPFLLEFNKGPDMLARDEIDEKMKTNIQTDMFKTIGLLENKNPDKNLFYLIYEK